jgi:hypothetical protein
VSDALRAVFAFRARMRRVISVETVPPLIIARINDAWADGSFCHGAWFPAAYEVVAPFSVPIGVMGQAAAITRVDLHGGVPIGCMAVTD